MMPEAAVGRDLLVNLQDFGIFQILKINLIRFY